MRGVEIPQGHSAPCADVVVVVAQTVRTTWSAVRLTAESNDERRTSPRTRERLTIAKPLGSRLSVNVVVIALISVRCERGQIDDRIPESAVSLRLPLVCVSIAQHSNGVRAIGVDHVCFSVHSNHQLGRMLVSHRDTRKVIECEQKLVMDDLLQLLQLIGRDVLTQRCDVTFKRRRLRDQHSLG